MKVKDFLKSKGSPLITVGKNETADLAIQKLLEHNIGALPVCDAKGDLVGIVSERDLLKICSLRSGEVNRTEVKDIMSKEVAICVPEDDLDYVMNTMTKKAVRHIPIMVGAKPEGIISIRDIMEERLEECKLEVRHLSDYISGGYV